MHPAELHHSIDRPQFQNQAGENLHLQTLPLPLPHDPTITSASTVSTLPDPNVRSSPTRPRKKKRVYTSCRQCRKRRCACSREFPCYACVSRNEGDQCDWSGASPQFIKSKGQINRDSTLVRLESHTLMRIKQDFESLHGHVDSLIDLLRQRFPSSSAVVIKPEIVPVTNFHIEDVATQLSRFTLNQAMRYNPQMPLRINSNSQISVKEVEEYVEMVEKKALPDFTFNMGSGGFIDAPPSTSRIANTSPAREGLLGIGKGPTSFEAILEGIPKYAQITACLEQFEHNRAWMHRILHRPTFWNQVSKQIHHNFAYTDQQAQAHWLAILFSVCGLGLFNNTIKSASTLKSCDLPSSVQGQRALALCWCRAATSCLEIGAFATTPSMDSISAMAILAQLPFHTSNGETLVLALEFIGKAIDLAVQLELHIDPDSHPIYQNATPLVKQNRRRLMVALLCQHYKIAGLLCQDHELRPLEQFSKLQLPLDQNDEDFSEDGQLTHPRTSGTTHTIMTGVRCRFQVSRIWQEIGILFSNPVEPPTHETVLEINTRLQQLPLEWPETIRTKFNPPTCAFTPPFTLPPHSPPGLRVLLIDRLACMAVFAAAMVRLHRGFLMEIDGVPVEDIKMHRDQTYHYGRVMLALHRTKVFPLDNIPLQFFVLSSTISLAVYCLTQTSSDEDDKCEVVAKELGQVKNVLKLCTGLSSVLRRTYAVLDFALNKWATIKRRSNPVKSRPHKRFKADADNQSQQESNNVKCTRDQVGKGNEVQVSPGVDNSGAVEPQEDSGYDPRMMENLSKFLMQDLQWVDDFDLPRDKQQHHKPQPPFPNNVDWSNIFQPNFFNPTTTNASIPLTVGNGCTIGNTLTVGNNCSSTVGNPHIAGKINTTLGANGSSIPYLSPSSSSSSNSLNQGGFNKSESKTPISLNYPSTLPFGSSFDQSQHDASHQSIGNVTNPILSPHSVNNASCTKSETIPGLTKTHLDGNFEIDPWPDGNNVGHAGYNVLNPKST